MVFHFVQGRGVVMLLDESLDEIENLLLSLGEHRMSFDLLSMIARLRVESMIKMCPLS